MRMYSILSVFLCMVPPLCALGEGPEISDFRLLIDGQPGRFLTVFQLQSEVRALLGQPKENKEEPGEYYTSTIFVEWYYNGCEVVFVKGDDQVDSILVTGDMYSTPRGLRIGDSEAKVISSYGSGKKLRDPKEKGYYILYSVTVDNLDPVLGTEEIIFSFLIKDKVVTKIVLNAVGQGAD